ARSPCIFGRLGPHGPKMERDDDGREVDRERDEQKANPNRHRRARLHDSQASSSRGACGHQAIPQSLRKAMSTFPTTPAFVMTCRRSADSWKAVALGRSLASNTMVTSLGS